MRGYAMTQRTLFLGVLLYVSPALAQTTTPAACGRDSTVAAFYRSELEHLVLGKSADFKAVWVQDAETCNSARKADSTTTSTLYVYVLTGTRMAHYAVVGVQARQADYCFYDRRWRLRGVCLMELN